MYFVIKAELVSVYDYVLIHIRATFKVGELICFKHPVVIFYGLNNTGKRLDLERFLLLIANLQF